MTGAEMTVTAKGNRKGSKLFALSRIDSRDDTEDKMESNYALLAEKFVEVSENEMHDALRTLVGQNMHEDVSLGLLYGILTNAAAAPLYYRGLTFVTRDGLTFVLTKVNWMAIEMFPKLMDSVCDQLLWFVGEVIRSGVVHMEVIFLNLLRWCSAGDLSRRNVRLADSLVTILLENRAWLEKTADVIPHAVYAFLRLIPDHAAETFDALRQKEITFCLTMLRERFTECSVLGRDLVRLLVGVGGMAQFAALWRDLLLSPSSFSPQFSGVEQLMVMRASRRFFISRLSFELERRLFFLLINVKAGNQHYYLEWLEKQYFHRPESCSLRQDVIRYVCSCVHPHNSVLASDVIPRWSFLVWLLGRCSSDLVEMQQCKLALFFDWFFFSPEQDSIMNVEPGLLAIFHCLRSQPSVSASLLEFLILTVAEFHPPSKERMKSCVRQAFALMLEKGVVMTLQPLVEGVCFNSPMKAALMELLPDGVCCIAPPTLPPPLPPPPPPPPPADMSPPEGEFSDSEVEMLELDESAAAAAAAADAEKPSSDGVVAESTESSVPEAEAEKLPSKELHKSLKSLLDEMQACSDDQAAQCDQMQSLLLAIFRQEDFDVDLASVLAEHLCSIFKPLFRSRIFARRGVQENEKITSTHPLFVLFRNLCLTPEDDASRQPLLLLLAEMYEQQQRIGYLLLYFLRCTNAVDRNMSPYVDLVKMLDREVQEMLASDLELCVGCDLYLFFFLLPDMINMFTNGTAPLAKLVHLIVANMDSVLFQDFLVQSSQGDFQLFRRDTFAGILQASLAWETMDQLFFWQLVSAERVPIDWVQSVIPKLEYPKHCEAMASIGILLRHLDRDPSTALVRQILLRKSTSDKDLWAATMLQTLIDDYEDRTADLISTQLSKLVVSKPSGGSKSAAARKTVAKIPTLEQVLSHLDQYRCFNRRCHVFFSKDKVAAALNLVQRRCTESVRKQFAELFSILEVLDSVRGENRTLRRVRRNVASNKKTNVGESSEDD